MPNPFPLINLRDKGTTLLQRKSKFHLVFKAFIPNTLHLHWKDAPWFDGPMESRLLGPHPIIEQFKGDDRDFFQPGTSRLTSWAEISVSELGGFDIKTGHSIGPTHRRKVAASWTKVKAVLSEDVRTAPDDDMKERIEMLSLSPKPEESSTKILFVGSAAMPFYPKMLTPAIDYNIEYMIKSSRQNGITLSLSGRHNCFPGYESYALVGESLAQLYKYDPAANREFEPGLYNLSMCNERFERPSIRL